MKLILVAILELTGSQSHTMWLATASIDGQCHVVASASEPDSAFEAAAAGGYDVVDLLPVSDNMGMYPNGETISPVACDGENPSDYE